MRSALSLCHSQGAPQFTMRQVKGAHYARLIAIDEDDITSSPQPITTSPARRGDWNSNHLSIICQRGLWSSPAPARVRIARGATNWTQAIDGPVLITDMPGDAGILGAVGAVGIVGQSGLNGVEGCVQDKEIWKDICPK
jgi:hypothetical protein